MRNVWICVLIALFLAVPAVASDLPGEVTDAAPAEADGLEGLSFSEGISAVWERIADSGRDLVRGAIRGGVQLLLVLIVCGVGEAAFAAVEAKQTYLTLAGVAAVVAVTAGDLHQLIGMGVETMGELDQFSKGLLPALAASTAASGMAGTAAMRQVATVFCCDLLLTVINRLLLPLLYLYIGALAAGAMLGDGRLDTIAVLLRKGITWTLGTLLTLFTMYLTVAGAISGAADAAALRVTKSAISAAVPVVGTIVSGAAETVLVGAALLKNSIGIFGVLAILATCALPFLQLGVQYVLYKLVAFAAGTVASPTLVKLIDGLGSAFGLVLGMVGSCGILLTISVLSALLAVQG